MRPTVAADTLQRNLTQYLTTTFGLTEEQVRRGLEGFLTHPEQGVFRGPYLRIRTPFRVATDGWREALEWAPLALRSTPCHYTTPIGQNATGIGGILSRLTPVAGGGFGPPPKI